MVGKQLITRKVSAEKGMDENVFEGSVIYRKKGYERA